MSDPFLDLAPIAALKALDGEDRLAFDAHVVSCASCLEALRGYERTASYLSLAPDREPPSEALRRRLLQAVAPLGKPRAPRLPWGVAAALALALVALALRLNVERVSARRQADILNRELGVLGRELDAARVELERATLLRELVTHGSSRQTLLAGTGPTPGARGRVIWNPATRVALLAVFDLPPASAGKVYEAWVIAKGAPAPAGLFQVDGQGRATQYLPRLEETADPKTFAVTLEPEAGVLAPTGPVVLAGSLP